MNVRQQGEFHRDIAGERVSFFVIAVQGASNFYVGV